ncbi:MAG TPA: AAA family ATPase [Streptomyces sp.]|nr:AAA family ATPase [Streptomyces sp.]
MWTRIGDPEVLAASGGEGHGRLVGRDTEAGTLRDLLREHRLVTVTGPAGVGKSRLAAAVVTATRDATRQHVVPVCWQGPGRAEPGALAATVLRAVSGIRPRRDPAGVDAVLRALPGERNLLFVDDVDPVHEECVGLVQHLLMTVPGLRVLVTARRPLGLGDERVVRLGPLDVRRPDAAGAGAPDGGDAYGAAVELFLARARTVVDGFRPEGAELDAVTEICETVEGMPLAVELAAAQLDRHRPAEVARLLRRHQCWLTDPHRPLRRHRSVREAIGSGYVLCDRTLRVVWGRASAFSGPFTEATAVFLCAGGGVEPHDVPGALARLAAIGVLELTGDPGGLRTPRYRMRRAARDFGAERLRQAGESDVAAERLMVHCRRVASVAGSLWSTGSQAQAVRLVRDEADDVTAMVEYALRRPERSEHVEAALAAVVDLWFWWSVYDRWEQGRDLLLRLLPLCDPADPLLVRGLWLAAWLAVAGDPETARTLLGRAWPAAVLAGDDATIGRIAHVEGMLALHRGDVHCAAEHFGEAARTIPPYAPGGPSPAVSLAARAVAQAMFDPGAARRSARRALSRPGIRHDNWARLVARYARAFVDHRAGHAGRARHRARRALATLDPALPAPYGAEALVRLIGEIEGGTGPRLRLRPAPLSRPLSPRATAGARR